MNKTGLSNGNGMSNSKIVEWFVMEKIRKINPMTCAELWCAYSYLFQDFGKPMDAAVSFVNKDTCLFLRRDQFKENGKILLQKLLSDHAWWKQKDQNIYGCAQKYFEVGRKLLKIKNFSKFSNEELKQLFVEYYDTYLASHISGQWGILLEFEHEWLSKHVKDLLEKRIKEKKLNLDIANVFSVLSTPLKGSAITEEQNDFYKLLSHVTKSETIELFKKSPEEIEKLLPKTDSEFNDLMEKHFQNYCWLPFMYEGPSWKKEYFIKAIKSSLQEKINAKKMLEGIQKVEQELEKQQKEFLKKLDLSKDEKELVFFVQNQIYLKGLRKDAMYFGSYSSEPLFKEIAKRLHLTLDQVRYSLKQELVKALDTGQIDANELNERIKFSVARVLDGKFEFISKDHAQRFFSQIYKEEVYENITQILGTTAFEGQVEGITKLVNHPNEMFKMDKGDIMVSHSTNPNLVSAMKKASAIITDVGGITCHAAIVSRELKIPCIVGTRIATKILKDGTHVQVDASTGVIKILKQKNGE